MVYVSNWSHKLLPNPAFCFLSSQIWVYSTSMNKINQGNKNLWSKNCWKISEKVERDWLEWSWWGKKVKMVLFGHWGNFSSFIKNSIKNKFSYWWIKNLREKKQGILFWQFEEIITNFFKTEIDENNEFLRLMKMKWLWVWEISSKMWEEIWNYFFDTFEVGIWHKIIIFLWNSENKHLQ